MASKAVLKLPDQPRTSAMGASCATIVAPAVAAAPGLPEVIAAGVATVVWTLVPTRLLGFPLLGHRRGQKVAAGA